MTASISSEALLPFVAWPTDRRTKYYICRIDAHIQEECAHKMIASSYIEKITFPPKPDRQIYRHTDRRTLAFIE